MNLNEVLSAINKYGDSFVEVALTESRVIRGILKSAFNVYENDPRGYKEPYFVFLRIDGNGNPTEQYNCSEIINIERI